VKDGDITLTGSVRTGTEREPAEAMVAELTGVCSVRNDIQILDRSSHERLARDQSRDR
jgi:osmotically-inducible protein OsmY